MEISVFGQHINLGQSLQKYVKSRTKEVVQKYFHHPIWAKIHFNKHGYEFHCDITINEGTGHHYVIKSDGVTNAIYSCFDVALATLEKQLRKYKSKLLNRHARIKPSDTQEVTKFVIENILEAEEVEDQIKSDNPVIIAEKSVTISTLSVDQAVMIMDLEDLPALMFKNSQTGRINMIYKKKCGNIAWIDSPE